MIENLSEHHLKALNIDSAISEEMIAERGYRTVMLAAALPPMFSVSQERTAPGLLIPVIDPAGSVATYQFKPDLPRVIDGKPVKYETAAGGRMAIDVHPRARPYLESADIPLWITEGVKKGDAAVSHGVKAIVALLGVTTWTSFGVALPDWADIRIKGRICVIAFDSDVMQKRSVRMALTKLAKWLAYRGGRVRYLILPSLPDGSKCGLDDWFAAGHTADELERYIVDILPGGLDDWPDPLPTEGRELHVLEARTVPGIIGEFSAALAAEAQVAEGMVVSMANGAVSACIGGEYRFVDPWEEPVHIMTIRVDNPGSRKSVCHRKVTAPVRRQEQALVIENQPRVREWESKMRVLESKLKTIEIACANPERKSSQAIQDPDLQRSALLEEIQNHLAKRVYPPRTLLDDATAEYTKRAMAENPNGAIGVLSAEPAFIKNTVGSRYSDEPVFEVILQGHAADDMTVGRIGRETDHIPRACLTICVAMQPEVVRGLGDGFRQLGGAARFLPEMTPSPIGYRQVSPPSVPLSLTQRWERTIQRLMTEKPPRTEIDGVRQPCDLRLSDAASRMFREFREAHEPRMRKDGDLYDIADWGSKMPGAILRLSGIIHVTLHEQPWDVDVSTTTLAAAIDLAEHYADHARGMYELMGNRADESDLSIVLDALRELPSPTTKRALHQRLRNRVKFKNNLAATDAALQSLEELGWIRIERSEPEVARPDGKKAGGRPSLVIELNPKAHTQNTRKPAPVTPLRRSDTLAPTGTSDEGEWL